MIVYSIDNYIIVSKIEILNPSVSVRHFTTVFYFISKGKHLPSWIIETASKITLLV